MTLGQAAQRPLWRAEFIDDTRQGFWTIINDNWEGEIVGHYQHQEQAEFGAYMLEHGGIPYQPGDDLHDLEESLDEELAPTPCVVCGTEFMAAQVHNERCIEHQS